MYFNEKYVPNELASTEIGNCCGTRCIYGFTARTKMHPSSIEKLTKDILSKIIYSYSGGYFQIYLNQAQISIVPIIEKIGFKKIKEFRNYNSEESYNPIMVFELVLNTVEDMDSFYYLKDKYWDTEHFNGYDEEDDEEDDEY